MKLREQIINDLKAHQQFGEPIALLETFRKYQYVCDYDHFRYLLTMEGVATTKYLENLIRACQYRGEKGDSPNIGLDFAKKKNEFSYSDLQRFVSVKRGIHYEGTSHLINKLKNDGHIERIGLGRYRSLVAA